jgi:glycosyltransferase involved in cell wall biosynthesis
MKILLVNKYFYRRGGSETYYFALGEALREAGHEVIWFSMDHPENLPCGQSGYFVEFVDYNAPEPIAKKLRHAFSSIYSKEAKAKFKRLLLDERPDIVHINNVQKQITLSILEPCVELGIPVVATSHDWIYVCPNYQKLKNGVVCELCQDGNLWNCLKTGCVQGSRLRSLLATLESVFYRKRGSYDKISLYIAPSECMAQRMRDAGFTRAEVAFMRNFLPGTDFNPREPSDPPYFIYLGRLVPEKGVHTLIRAYAKAAPPPMLYILGEGPARGELEKLAGELGVSGKVCFMGSRYGDELTELTGGSLALVLPSEIMENCPYSVMEALAMGKPVIGSRIGGIPELIIEGETGFCYAPGDVNDLAGKLTRMAALNGDTYAGMSRLAREYAVEHFSKTKYTSALIQKYESLLATKAD